MLSDFPLRKRLSLLRLIPVASASFTCETFLSFDRSVIRSRNFPGSHACSMPSPPSPWLWVTSYHEKPIITRRTRNSTSCKTPFILSKTLLIGLCISAQFWKKSRSKIANGFLLASPRVFLRINRRRGSSGKGLCGVHTGNLFTLSPEKHAKEVVPMRV